MMKPFVGRIVHFYDYSIPLRQNNGVGPGPYAAIIVQVFPDGSKLNETTQQPEATTSENALVNLKIFAPISERETGTNSIEGSVYQRPNDTEYREGRFFVEPPRV